MLVSSHAKRVHLDDEEDGDGSNEAVAVSDELVRVSRGALGSTAACGSRIRRGSRREGGI